jgi:hypothetical protein
VWKPLYRGRLLDIFLWCRRSDICITHLIQKDGRCAKDAKDHKMQEEDCRIVGFFACEHSPKRPLTSILQLQHNEA